MSQPTGAPESWHGRQPSLVQMSLRRSPLVVRPSPISGLGAFATRPIRKGSRIIEYSGERITPDEADTRYRRGPSAHPLVLLFSVDSRTVIEAAVNGNEARYVNHSCEPNCEAVIKGRRIWIHALRDMQSGEELTYDYNLTGDEEDEEAEADLYPCHCNARSCRGTMFRLGGRSP